MGFKFGPLSKSALLILVLFATWHVAEAVTITLGPKSSWTKEQKTEFYLGVYGGMLKLCGYYSEGQELEDLASMSPYGREGIPGFDFDEYGGNCAELKEEADKYFLSRKDYWFRLLSTKYGQTVKP